MKKVSQYQEPKEIFLLSSTHWDREWYLPFQAMRFKLAETLDELMDVLESQPDFELFCLDGQTIVLEDYAAAAPENAERLKTLIRSGRIKIGPWYVMPDERLVSGESMIHNFLQGRRVAARWGAETWKFGYLCDIFGHIGQMPQILRGFGIGGAYLGRGLGEDEWRGGFRWRGPDGSQVTGYLDCYAKFTQAVTYRYGTQEYPAALKEELERHAALDTSPVWVLADAFDHTPVNPHTQEILADIQKLYPEARVRHDSLEAMAEAMKPYEDRLPLRRNELTVSTADMKKNLRVVTHSISSYYPLKRQNDQCQHFLEKLAEPLNALAAMRGMKTRPALMELAWKYLLQNQPHDSICGCSVDQVHVDMRYRYDQTREIGTEILNRAVDWLWKKEEPGEKMRLSFYNPFLYDWEAPIRLEVPMPQNFPTSFAEPAGYERRCSFRLYDGQNREIPYQLHRIRRNVVHRLKAQQNELVDMYDLSLTAPLTALGGTYLRVEPDRRPVRFDGQNMTWGADWCDNGLLRLEIAADGTLTLLDHRTGKVYAGLNRFADDGEDGNGWFHDEPVGNELRLTDTACVIRRTAAGPVCVTFVTEQRLPLPKGREEAEKTALKLETTVTLWKNKACADVRLKVENPASDHRLRALFPTGSRADTYVAGQTFFMTERPVGRRKDALCWDEPDPEEKDTTGILYSRDENGGLAFVAPEGLHEGGVSPDGVIAVTLLRSFSRAFLADEPTACRLLGTHEFHYALVPLSDTENNDSLLHLQEQLAIRLPEKLDRGEPGWDDPVLKLRHNRLMVSTIKNPETENEKELVIRLWNPSGEERTEILETGFALENAWRMTMDEREKHPLAVSEKQVRLSARPWEILTVLLKSKE